MEPRISVVIAAYRPGSGIDRVVASLDAQTLPQEQFETIVVDDGSPDDTFDRLSALAATRPNMRVHRIENSGWAGRPRNVGTGIARGDWVLFMDHDDSLYPDALRRMADFAAETRADVVSPKESKTNDVWWGGAALRDHNVTDAVQRGGIDDLLPMVPHKLYRRAFLDEHGIRFPEGRRQLWEDIYLNVEAWRHAERVAVLTDTPAYLWHASASNNSRSYGPRDEEYWDRLEDLFGFIDRTLDDPRHAADRRAAILHQYRNRLLTRFSKALQGASPSVAQMGLRRAQAIQQRFVPEAWDATLGKHVAARAVLLRAGRADLLEALWAADSTMSAPVTAGAVEWQDGVLRVDLTTRWQHRDGTPVRLRRAGTRLVRDLPPQLLAALPAHLTDLSDSLAGLHLDAGVRDRPDHVTWPLPHDRAAEWEGVDDDHVTPVLSAAVRLDPRSAAAGDALLPHPHDLVARTGWEAEIRQVRVGYDGRSAAAMLGSRPAVAYRSQRGTLSLDLSATLRNPVADGVGPGRFTGHAHRLVVPLPRVHVQGSGALPAAIRLEPEGDAPAVVLEGTIHSNAEGARLVLSASRPPSGDYRATFGADDGPFRGGRPAQVHGSVLTLLPRDPGAARPKAPPLIPRLLGGVRRRLSR